MPCVVGAFFGFYEHIIDINILGFTYQGSEYLGHHPLISFPYIFQAKRHYIVVVRSVGCDEGRFLRVMLVHKNLMVSAKASRNERIPCLVVASTI